MNDTSIYLELADGTVLEESQCGYADHTLWCYIKDKTMGEVFAMFSDQEKTRTITFHHNGIVDTYSDFIVLNLIKQSEFVVQVRLVKEGGYA